MGNVESNKFQLLAESLNELKTKQNYEEDIPALFSLFFEIATEGFAINFTSLFSRIAFCASHYKYPIQLNLDNHYFRKTLDQNWSKDTIDSQILEWSILLIWRNLNFLEPTIEIPKDVQSDFVPRKEIFNLSSYQRIVNAIIQKDENDQFIFSSADTPSQEYNLVFESEIFTKQLSRLFINDANFITVNLIDVTQISEDEYKARAFVFEPDYLVGVTSISECFSADGVHAFTYLMRKLLPTDYTVHMLTGNIVNYFLDELIHDGSLEFDQLLPKVFQLDPMAFLSMDNEDLRTLLDKLREHFERLKKSVSMELANLGITKDNAYLEPSFYSSEYGMQGRLDLYYHDPQNNESDIIELKSGKLYKANNYGINENHFVQTLLYDLLLESVNSGRIRSKNYILYSSLSEQALRYAPRVRQKQIDAMALRNELMFIEDLLASEEKKSIVHLINTVLQEDIDDRFRFLKRDINKFKAAIQQMDQIEKSYYLSFLGFLSRELTHSKLGEHGAFKSNGLASLWLDSYTEKKNTFRILNLLEIIENCTDEVLPILRFKFSDQSNLLSRFRIGDIAVLYPHHEERNDLLRQQLFKCTIVELSENNVSVRLRARQKNPEIFNTHQYWNIESDVLDSSFNKMYHGLFEFLISHKSKRSKILCQEAPGKPDKLINYKFDDLSQEQNRLLQKAINSPDYFLLWGPPGTGKTSRMIKSLVDYYFSQTDQNIYLLAFTNRAVDEMCKAIENVIGKDYIRIGSRYSTEEAFKSQLLSMQLENIERRSALTQLITSKRVFVSTVSSFQSVRNLSKIKPYDLVIVDEASQLLEPQIVSTLSHFRKFILIGDHKQLPAVVTQVNSTRIDEESKLSKATGLKDMANSLFERMMSNAIQNDWDWAYGQLTQQGRMHQDILEFVTNEFYDGKLKRIEGIPRLSDQPQWRSMHDLSNRLISERMIFINTPLDPSFTHKINKHEAEVVVKLIKIWKSIYKENNKAISSEDIGVITPFRSQIALITKLLKGESSKNITLDTIERYQGGSRNQIIISLAVSQAQLLESITNVSDEGIDRKLNVALSRAKENLILIGSKVVLSQNPVYKRLISTCHEIQYDEILEL